MGRLLPVPEALEFSVEYAGVVAFGTGRVVEDVMEAKAALQSLLDKYAPHLTAGEDYRPTTDEELARTAVYRLDVETWSGKAKRSRARLPGCVSVAPSYGAVPPPHAPGSMIVSDWGENQVRAGASGLRV